MKPVNRPGARSAPETASMGAGNPSVSGQRSRPQSVILEIQLAFTGMQASARYLIDDAIAKAAVHANRFWLRPIAAYPIKTGVRDASTVSRMNLASDAQSLRVYLSDASLRERCPLPSPGVAAQCRKCAAIFRGCGHSHQAMPGSSQRVTSRNNIACRCQGVAERKGAKLSRAGDRGYPSASENVLVFARLSCAPCVS
jgi:hypothetical protein